MGTWYTIREDIQSAQDIRASAYNAAQIDNAIESSSRAVDSLLKRSVYPFTATRYFDWPAQPSSRAWRLWLGHYPLIAPTAITNNDGSSIPIANVFLDPQDGPPYTSVQVSLATTSAFAVGTTMQRAVGITGLWGISNNETAPTVLASSPSSVSTTVQVATAATIGVGSVLRIDSERMNVTDRTWTATSDTATLAAASSTQALTVADGTKYLAGERLMVDSEELIIGAVTGNVLTVRRASNGSTLAQHTGATVYALRTLVVSRGALGTTAASHTSSTAVQVWTPPSQAAELCRAYTLVTLQGLNTAYQAATGGTGNTASSNSLGLAGVEARASMALGYQMRTDAV